MSLRSRQSIRCPYAEKASASLYGGRQCCSCPFACLIKVIFTYQYKPFGCRRCYFRILADLKNFNLFSLYKKTTLDRVV